MDKKDINRVSVFPTHDTSSMVRHINHNLPFVAGRVTGTNVYDGDGIDLYRTMEDDLNHANYVTASRGETPLLEMDQTLEHHAKQNDLPEAEQTSVVVYVVRSYDTVIAYKTIESEIRGGLLQDIMAKWKTVLYIVPIKKGMSASTRKHIYALERAVDSAIDPRTTESISIEPISFVLSDAMIKGNI